MYFTYWISSYSLFWSRKKCADVDFVFFTNIKTCLRVIVLQYVNEPNHIWFPKILTISVNRVVCTEWWFSFASFCTLYISLVPTIKKNVLFDILDHLWQQFHSKSPLRKSYQYLHGIRYIHFMQKTLSSLGLRLHNFWKEVYRNLF